MFFSDSCINGEKQYGDTTAEAFQSPLAYLTAHAFQGATGSTFVYGPGWTSGTTSIVGFYGDLLFNGDAAYLLVNFVTGAGGTLAVKNAAGTTVASVVTGGHKQNLNGALKLAGFGAGDHTPALPHDGNGNHSWGSHTLPDTPECCLPESWSVQ